MILLPSGALIGLDQLVYISPFQRYTKSIWLRWAGDSEGLELKGDDAVAFHVLTQRQLVTDTAFVPKGEDDDSA